MAGIIVNVAVWLCLTVGLTAIGLIAIKLSDTKTVRDWLARNEDRLRDTFVIVIFFALLFFGWDCVPPGDGVLGSYVFAASLGMAALARRVWISAQDIRKIDQIIFRPAAGSGGRRRGRNPPGRQN